MIAFWEQLGLLHLETNSSLSNSFEKKIIKSQTNRYALRIPINNVAEKENALESQGI